MPPPQESAWQRMLVQAGLATPASGLVVGVDGGGTSTRCAVVEMKTGSVVAEAQSGSSNKKVRGAARRRRRMLWGRRRGGRRV